MFKSIDTICISLFAFFTISSCHVKKSSEHDADSFIQTTSSSSSYILLKTKGLSIPIDHKTPSVVYEMFFSEHDSVRWLHFVDGLNTIHFYDIDHPESNLKVILEKTGPNGVGNVSEYHLYNMDSIFVAKRTTPYIYLVDTAGKVKDKFERSDLASTNAFAIKKMDQKLVGIFTNAPLGNWHHADPVNHRIISKSWLKENKSEKLSLTYPKVYDENNLARLSFYCTFPDNRIIVSFQADHYLHEVNLSTLNSTSHLARSLILKNIDQAIPSGLKYSDNYKKYIQISKYLKILYDPYRNLYYRFTKIGTDVDQNIDLMRQIHFPKRQSVVVLNENFEWITELELPPNRYVPKNAFVAQEGLYISCNHPENPDLNEDFLKFDVFQLIEDSSNL